MSSPDVEQLRVAVTARLLGALPPASLDRGLTGFSLAAIPAGRPAAPGACGGNDRGRPESAV